MMRVIRVLGVSFPLVFGLIACAPEEPASHPQAVAPDILPLRSLRLYETGVGYFERSGTIGGHTATSLPVPAGHLDDALKSLVVLNGGAGGTVSGISFTSSVTKATARARAGLPANPDAPIEFKDLLASMKGERVTILLKSDLDKKEPLAGRLLEVTMESDNVQARALAMNKDAKADTDPKRLVLTLLSDHGELAQIAADDVAKIRPADAAFAARLDAALDSLSTRNTQNARALRLLGDARGAVTFGYIAETPIWRASYRLIFKGNTATIQGWALLHNDTDENWRDVHLELVNGEPDSFIFPLAAPRYSRRELVHPIEPLSTVPQLQDTTADAIWGDHLDAHGGGTGYGEGFGSGHGRLGGSHSSRAPSIRMGATSVNGRLAPSSLLEVGNLADLAAQPGVEQGAMFVYSVPAGFSLEAHASALVPFVQKSVDVENVAFFASLSSPARAAVRFVNGTGQTLPAGTIAVFESGGFSGETALDRLKPGERRFLQIANDIDTEITEKKITKREEAKRLTFENDQLFEHFLQTTDNSWELENRSGSARAFYVTLAANQNAKVTGSDRVDYDEESKSPVAVFDMKPKTKVTRAFTIVEGLSRQMTLDSISEKYMRALLLKTTIPAADLAVLAQALDKARALEAGRKTVEAADSATGTAQEELERLREDMKALGGGAAGTGAAAAPLVKRVVDAEDKVETARKNKEAAQKTLEEKREALREALKKLAPPPPT